MDEGESAYRTGLRLSGGHDFRQRHRFFAGMDVLSRHRLRFLFRFVRSGSGSSSCKDCTKTGGLKLQFAHITWINVCPEISLGRRFFFAYFFYTALTKQIHGFDIRYL